MFTSLLSRLVIVAVGTIYPAYCSYKAIQYARTSKNANDMGHWLMYWIVYALFSVAETFTDTLVFWFPFYHEVKLLFVLWLVLPITKGSRYLYKKFVHPYLEAHEQEIDAYIAKAGEKGLETIKKVGQQGYSFATTTMISSAIKGQAAVTEVLQRSRENSTTNLQPEIQRYQQQQQQQQQQRFSQSDSDHFEIIEVDSTTGYQATTTTVYSHTEEEIAPSSEQVQPRRSRRKLPTPSQ
ncbi:receptor expression-enhancing protein 1-like [Dysidea avara]|uniref:receptor expression-enhancing protein 1-like n=1 Tax=Dysidea avara TaxID=196820 RepID=UPI0033298C61